MFNERLIQFRCNIKSYNEKSVPKLRYATIFSDIKFIILCKNKDFFPKYV
jgi:hypothetical protein